MDNKKKFTEKFEVVDGPSKDRLLDAFKYLCDSDANVDIHFTVKMPNGKLVEIQDIRIISIGYEDGSGMHFVLSGDCDGRALGYVDVAYDSNDESTWHSASSLAFFMYFDCRDRHGYIRLP